MPADSPKGAGVLATHRLEDPFAVTSVVRRVWCPELVERPHVLRDTAAGVHVLHEAVRASTIAVTGRPGAAQVRRTSSATSASGMFSPSA